MNAGNHNNILGKTEQLSKLIVLSAAVLYVLGYLVVSLFLGQYNVSSLNLVRAQYILAGLWLILPLVATGIICAWFTSYLVSEYRQVMISTKKVAVELEAVPKLGRPRWIRVLRAFGLTFLSVSFGVTVLKFLVGHGSGGLGEDLSVSPPAESVVFVLLFCAIAGGCWAAGLWFLRKARQSESKDRTVWRLHAVAMLATAGMFTLGYVGFFAARIYPHIPSVFGGGQPRKVQFLLPRDRQINHILQEGDTKGVSKTYGLLIALDKTYVILVDEEASQTIEFGKSLVDGIVIGVKDEAKTSRLTATK